MFAKIRNRLTLRYALVMMLLMTAFIVTSSAGLLWILYQEERQDLKSFAAEEAREHVEMLNAGKNFFYLASAQTADYDIRMFYYIFNNQKQIVSAEEPPKTVRAGVLRHIRNWEGGDGEVLFKKIELPKEESAIILLCSLKITDGSQELGRVFVGEDVSAYYHMLKMFLITMLVLSAIFLLIAAFAGHLLAGKAMVPINRSFARQREFVADASHELRTPLSILQISVEAVESDTEQKLSPFSRQTLTDLQTEIRRMTKMVSDLLTLARADAGASNIFKEKLDLTQLAESLLRLVQPLAAAKEIDLTLTAAADLVLLADRERIKQLILILLDNAIKYTPAGGKVELALNKANTKGVITIAVHDTGEGIAANELELIFERFYRVDKVRSRQEGGSGLGLAIAHWIAAAHGGKIQVKSLLGKGSSFLVSLPPE
jgi:signal transduction histidine kinase